MNLRLARWPVHLPPEPLESLSSWLTRLAGVYGLTVKALLTDLCAVADVNVGAASGVLDIDPPPPVLAVLAERTGVAVPRLRTMTLSGWAPWLFDRLAAREYEEYELFDNYVRSQSVLLVPGAQGRNTVHGGGRWSGPWHPRVRRPRACPACALDPGRGRALVWSLPLMISCVQHRCRLERFGTVVAGAPTGDPLTPVPVDDDVSALDGYTFAALTTGMVELPGRTVHAGVWFRLLRCLLDELAVAGWATSARTRAIVETVWDCADYPARAGLAVWPAYEHMDWEIQEKFLHAAAAAVRLAADGVIPALGELGPALVKPTYRPVPPGDPPETAYPPRERGSLLYPPRWWPARPIPAGPPRNWQHGLGAYVAGRYAAARVSRDAAHTLLQLLTRGCRTLDCFEEQRIWLFSQDIPLKFLPTAERFGRHDLQPDPAREPRP